MISQENLTNELTDQFEKLSNQARFVTMIIKRELNVSNRKKAAIVDDLRKLSFRPFPKAKTARAAGEEEDALEEADEGLASDYDYLLGMAIWSLTEEKVRRVFLPSLREPPLTISFYSRFPLPSGQRPPQATSRQGARTQRASQALAD